MHISELLQRPQMSLADLLAISTPATQPRKTSKAKDNRVLVIDCVTNVVEKPDLPPTETPSSSPLLERGPGFPAAAKMHLESRRRKFGSDTEMLARAICADKGWNAVISRRKRGCLACTIREAEDEDNPSYPC